MVSNQHEAYINNMVSYQHGAYINNMVSYQHGAYINNMVSNQHVMISKQCRVVICPPRAEPRTVLTLRQLPDLPGWVSGCQLVGWLSD